MGFETGNDNTGTIQTNLIGGVDNNGNVRAITLTENGEIKISGGAGGAANAVSTTGTPISVDSSSSAVLILPANTNRKGVTIFNNSTATLYLALGFTASLTSFTVKITASSYYEVPYYFIGVISGIWNAVNGNALITELT